MATTSSVINALRYTYGVNKVQYLFNQESPTYKNLSKVKKPVGGRGQFLIPILKQNAGAFTGITEGGTLPTALDPATTEASFKLQEYVGLYSTSWKLIQDSRSDKFAFQQAIQMLDDGLRRRIMRNLNADLISSGKGELFAIPSAQNSTTPTVAYLPRVETGMVVDVMAVADDTTKRATAVTVNGVDPVGRVVTLSGALSSSAAGDYAVIQSTTNATGPVCYHSNGLLGVINASNPATVVGNYGGVNRSTAGNEFWKAPQLTNSGTARALTEDLLLQALDQTREKGGGQLDMWLSNLAIVRRYHEILAAERFFALSSPGVLKGGIGRSNKDNASGDSADSDGGTPYQFSGIDWYVDPYFVNSVIVGLDTKHFFLGVGDNDAPRPISEIFDNIPFFRQTTSATFEVAWYYQMQLLSDNPAAGVQVGDVAES